MPDLVQAALDLLIDGEHGIWHLANQGAVTWADFARAIAVAASLDPGLVDDGRAVDVFGAATRPRYSPLVSGRATLLQPLETSLAAYVTALPPTIQRSLDPCA